MDTNLLYWFLCMYIILVIASVGRLGLKEGEVWQSSYNTVGWPRGQTEQLFTNDRNLDLGRDVNFTRLTLIGREKWQLVRMTMPSPASAIRRRLQKFWETQPGWAKNQHPKNDADEVTGTYCSLIDWLIEYIKV